MSGRADTARVRKAWRAQIMDPEYGLGEIIYAPTASKARYQKFLRADCDSIVLTNIRVTREPSEDIIVPEADDAITRLDKEQQSALTHTLHNGRFYTSTEDKTLCSLVQAGLAKNTGRGWNKDEVYFVLTDTGRTAAESLLPVYPEYPEYPR